MSRRKIFCANPTDKTWTRHSYVLWFGACGPTYVLVYANSLEDALEQAIEFCADRGWKGLYIDHGSEELTDLMKEACEEEGIPFPVDGPIDWSNDRYCRAEQKATADLTYTETGYIPSWEWGIALEDPSREDLIEFARG